MLRRNSRTKLCSPIDGVLQQMDYVLRPHASAPIRQLEDPSGKPPYAQRHASFGKGRSG